MLKIWGRPDSSNVQKVLWCCDELGLAYERVDLGGAFGGNDAASYRALNPNGLVPTIEDGDFVLWESNSIVRYLVDRYDARGLLNPSTAEGRGNASRWMDWQLTTISRCMFPLFQGLYRLPPEKRDPDQIESARRQAGEVWTILDRHLGSRRFVDGDRFSLGDIPPGVWIHRWLNMPIERPGLPHLRAWYARLGERPPYRTHVMIPLG
jgi:glutathione S-transferase